MRFPLVIGALAIGMLGSVACGSSGAITTPASHAAAVRPLSNPPSGCGTAPPRRAWAEVISAAGKLSWQLRLPTNATQSGVAVQPLVLGGTGVFAEENTVYALRITDGHRLWRRPFVFSGTNIWANMVYGLWQWRGTVVVLVGQASPVARLISLNSSTGAVRWTLELPQGLLGSQALTGDGGLAMIRGSASLTVVDLATGHVRWSRTASHSPNPVVAGGVVMVAADAPYPQQHGSVTGYDARTGKLLWTRHDMATQPVLQVSAGRVVVYDDAQQVYPRPPLWPVTALSPATGRTLWRVPTAGPVGAVSAGPSGVAVSTSLPSRLYLIDPGTGRLRWQIPASLGLQTPLDTGTDLLYIGRASTAAPLSLVDVRAADGSVRWSLPVPATASGTVFQFGGLAVITVYPSRPGSSGLLAAFRLATGEPAWTVKVPTMVQVTPTVAGADLLVQPTDPAIGCPATATTSVSAIGL